MICLTCTSIYPTNKNQVIFGTLVFDAMLRYFFTLRTSLNFCQKCEHLLYISNKQNSSNFGHPYFCGWFRVKKYTVNKLNLLIDLLTFYSIYPTNKMEVIFATPIFDASFRLKNTLWTRLNF